jgi:hydroxyethylthiazole kinase-like uncharacterized protein yjeF
MKLVTVEEMRTLERAAVEAGVSEAQMMEEAGLAVAQEAWMLLGSPEGRRIVVLAGPGKNGGDALVAARHLADWGAEVTCWLARERPNDPLVEELTAREARLVTFGQEGEEGLAGVLSGAELVIDGLLGIGKLRPLSTDQPMGQALARLAEARKGFAPPKVVAVDLPSGVDADSGAVDPLTVTPDVTVTFGFPKVGMYQAPASGVLGRVQVIDIGIPKAAQDAVALELMTSRAIRPWLPARPEDANKGTFGRLLVVGGCRRFIGAPRLAAVGAYRAGAGLVTIACPGGIIAPLAAGIAEATWLPLPETGDGGLAGRAALPLRQEWRTFKAAVIGPGMGLSEDTRALTWALLADIAEDVPGGVVIDADALNAIAAMPDGAERVPPQAILTPHPGEMARLLDCSIADVQEDRLASARLAAERFGCTVVLKGAHSVVAGPGGQARLSPWANPLLASAGTGDVLAGMIGAYLAQSAAPFEAACLGVYFHGAAAEALRSEMGEAGLLASDIATRLPSVVRELTQG